jgi:hypothetical protein
MIVLSGFIRTQIMNSRRNLAKRFEGGPLAAVAKIEPGTGQRSHLYRIDQPVRRCRRKMATWAKAGAASDQQRGRCLTPTGTTHGVTGWLLPGTRETMTRLHLVLAFVAAMAFATASSAAAQTHWTEYRPAGLGYRIELPGAPKEAVRKLPSGHPSYSATWERDDDYFSVRVSPVGWPQLWLPTEILYDLVQSAEVKIPKGALRAHEKLTVSSTPARRLIIDAPPEVYYILLVVKGDRFYQALYMATSVHVNEADMLHFLGSFAISAEADPRR